MINKILTSELREFFKNIRSISNSLEKLVEIQTLKTPELKESLNKGFEPLWGEDDVKENIK